MRTFIRNVILNLFSFVKKKTKPGIFVINSHYVSNHELNVENDTKVFDDYLAYLNQFAVFITLEEATKRIIERDFPKDQTLIAFTFDDGFEECYSIIAPLLEKYNTRGAFFINANYIGSRLDYQEVFHQRINTFTKKPMSWEQVVDLHKRGHLIGSHGLDHLDFSQIREKEIRYQLGENKRILEERLEYSCDYFAWSYGQMKHFPELALKITKDYHRFIFSGTNYKRYFSFNGQVINRRHLEPDWQKSHVKFFLGNSKKP